MNLCEWPCKSKYTNISWEPCIWTEPISNYLYTYLNGCQALLVQYVIKYCPWRKSIAGPRSTRNKLRGNGAKPTKGRNRIKGRNRSKGETDHKPNPNKELNRTKRGTEQRMKPIKGWKTKEGPVKRRNRSRSNPDQRAKLFKGQLKWRNCSKGETVQGLKQIEGRELRKRESIEQSKNWTKKEPKQREEQTKGRNK